MTMTVATQVKSCLASLKSSQASLETFALQTDNKEVQELFRKAAETTQSIVYRLDSRVKQMEFEEPQYQSK